MAKLSAADRKKLPDTAFALKGRRYPIHDEAHARDALARVSANGTLDERLAVHRAVKKKHPGISVGAVKGAPAGAAGASGGEPDNDEAC